MKRSLLQRVEQSIIPTGGNEIFMTADEIQLLFGCDATEIVRLEGKITALEPDFPKLSVIVNQIKYYAFAAIVFMALNLAITGDAVVRSWGIDELKRADPYHARRLRQRYPIHEN